MFEMKDCYFKDCSIFKKKLNDWMFEKYENSCEQKLN